MTAPHHVDAAVVGAGPAGLVTATELVRHGVRTLLIGDRRAGADHGLVLSGAAVCGLRAAGAATEGIAPPLAPPLGSLDICIGDATIAVSDTGSSVCGRARLWTELMRMLTAAGGERLPGRVTSLEHGPEGHRLVVDGTTAVRARHLVLATGAPARQGNGTGLVCAQRFAGAGLGSRIVLALATPRTVDPREPPTCAWAIPDAEDGTCTVSVTRMGPAGPQRLMEAALAALADAVPGVRDAAPLGPLVSGTLSSGFSPERAVRSRALLVGDAAGLANPFTGEGLSCAFQSALLAARTIIMRRDDPAAACRDYSRSLAATFVGYFETARHAARRYHLAWRILGATAGSDSPVFSKARRAILLPEGLAGITAAERMRLPRRDEAALRPFLVACDEVAVATIRREWPFIARLMTAGEDGPHRRLRPAVPFFGALLAGGGAPPVARAQLGAAIELAVLATLALLGPAPSGRRPAGSVDWATTTIILAGDFLLAQASRLVARSAPELSWSFADWLAEMTALRAAGIDPARRASPADLFGALLEFPTRIGGQLGGARPDVIAALRRYGHQCGQVFLYADDVLALQGHRTRLDTTLRTMLAGRISALPDLLGQERLDVDRLDADPQLRATALAAAVTACRDAEKVALHSVHAVTDAASARMLRQFVITLAEPAHRASGPS